MARIEIIIEDQEDGGSQVTVKGEGLIHINEIEEGASSLAQSFAIWLAVKLKEGNILDNFGGSSAFGELYKKVIEGE